MRNTYENFGHNFESIIFFFLASLMWSYLMYCWNINCNLGISDTNIRILIAYPFIISSMVYIYLVRTFKEEL